MIYKVDCVGLCAFELSSLLLINDFGYNNRLWSYKMIVQNLYYVFWWLLTGNAVWLAENSSEWKENISMKTFLIAEFTLNLFILSTSTENYGGRLKHWTKKITSFILSALDLIPWFDLIIQSHNRNWKTHTLLMHWLIINDITD